MGDKQQLRECAQRLHSLALFRPLLEDGVLGRLLALLDTLDGGAQTKRADAYCDFVAALYGEGGDLGSALLDKVLNCENAIVKYTAADREIPKVMARSLAEELGTFTLVSAIEPAELAARVGGSVALPAFNNTRTDFAAVYTRRMAEIHNRGYGIFASHHMFTLKDDGGLLPVKNPDPQRLEELTGYEAERGQIIINTRALLRGLPAGNILLYGDAGTGKSSTVKAIANAYRDRGLRLVEIRKNQIYRIPELMDKLAENPLRFILFIDDLSFPTDDADFTALKAILEGNVSARPRNIVVYATSNRRHMVKQRFSDRQGDDVSLADTLEEEASLAARFGLTITFLKPDKGLYGDIVRALAEEYDLRTPEAELLKRAEIHALRHGGRSPRTARQFAEFIKASEEDTLGVPPLEEKTGADDDMKILD